MPIGENMNVLSFYRKLTSNNASRGSHTGEDFKFFGQVHHRELNQLIYDQFAGIVELCV